MSGYSLWLVLYSTSFIAVYCFAVRLFSLVRVGAARQISHHRFFEGGEMVVSLTINQRSYIPLAWIVVQDEWIHNGSRQMYSHRRMFIPWFRSTFTYSYKVTGIRRGKYIFRKIKIITGDIFGFHSKGKQVDLPMNFTVYPKSLSSFRLIGDGLYYGERALKTMLQRNAIQVSSVRNYIAGDAMNRIHWKMSSRSDELKTKELESAVEDRIVIVLNAARSVDQQKSVFETCIQAAAGLLKYGKANQCRMALVCNSMNDYINRIASRAELAKCDDFLAEVVNQGTIPFITLLEDEIKALPSGTAVLCITPVLDASLIKVLPGIYRRGLILQIIYVVGSSTLTDQELQLVKQLESSGCCRLHMISGVDNKPMRVGIEDVGA